jgi:lipopolysaccharide transport system ATP-binding protein
LSSETAITVEGLGKRYKIGGRPDGYNTLRDTLSDAAALPMRALRSLRAGRKPPGGKDHFWALEGVSFEVKRGEVVGVIGRNGAGKSTLLKILSRITEPTVGFADITGRIGSLLEVGTGFHPELSGSENIYLNGAILGMKRAEIARKFDEIVAFAEVEQFIYTAVKHYSSGMYLRLAFAVAAHLEPEILLVDEVLAVGDAAFQKKCLGKMGEVANQGRTILFVSHNMGAIKELCGKGLLLEKGRPAFYGGSVQCVVEYFKRLEHAPQLSDNSLAPLVVGAPKVHGDDGRESVSSGQPFKISVSVLAKELRNPWIFFIVEDFAGHTIIHNRVTSREIGAPTLDGECLLEVNVPGLWLSPGVYAGYFKVIASTAGITDIRATSEKVMLEVDGDPESSGKAVLNPALEWKVNARAQAPACRV